MADIDVDLDDLDTISTGLADGATALEGLSVPDGPDAGLVSPSITSLLGQLATSAGNVASSMQSASESVAQAAQYYRRADAESSASLEQIDQAMEDA